MQWIKVTISRQSVRRRPEHSLRRTDWSIYSCVLLTDQQSELEAWDNSDAKRYIFELYETQLMETSASKLRHIDT